MIIVQIHVLTNSSGSSKLRKERVSEVYRGSDEGSSTMDTNSGFSLSLKEIPASLKTLFTNPTFMSLNMAGACEGKWDITA